MAEPEEKTPPRSDNFAVFTFFLIAMLWNCLALNFTHLRMPDPRVTPPLRDAGFDLIPIIRLQWITDGMIAYYNIVILLFYLYVSTIEGNLMKCRLMFNKYFLVWGYCMLMRGFSIMLTSLPATENHCQDPRHIESIWYNTIMGFVTFGGGNVHCGDLMFSGHTIAIMNGTCFVFHYAKKFPVLVAATLTCTCICIFVIIASRSHYSIDVYIGGLIAFLTFKVVPEPLPAFLAPLSALWGRFVNHIPCTIPRRKADSFNALL